MGHLQNGKEENERNKKKIKKVEKIPFELDLGIEMETEDPLKKDFIGNSCN
jgi:hypothetical protein